MKNSGQFTKGFEPWNKGLKLTAEHRKNLSEARMLSPYRTGKLHPKFKTGYSMNTNGYVRNGITRQYRHREIMESFIGRKLLRSEVVHHKNHNKLDNSIENLEILTSSEHTRMHLKEQWKSGKRVHSKKFNRWGHK